MGGQPVVALAAEHELEDADEVVRVLADVVKVHDLGHFREHRMPISGAVAATLQAVEQPSISAARRAVIWPGLSRRQHSYCQGSQQDGVLARIFIQTTLGRERSHMPLIGLAQQGSAADGPPVSPILRASAGARIRHASVTSSLSRSTSTFASRSITSGQRS
jgi:hypothetical protein